MSDFLVMSLDSKGSPRVGIPETPVPASSRSAGWGFGWYPDDDAAASVVKDSTSTDAFEFATMLSGWKSFNSTTFLIKVRGASKQYNQQSTQPFSRGYAGRDWLFMHNGSLDRRRLEQLFESAGSNSFHPIGTTDSELAFSVLLSRVKTAAAGTLSELPWETWHSWFQELDRLGTADFAISDGRHIIMYHGSDIDSAPSFARLSPGEEPIRVESPEVVISLDNPSDAYRTALVVGSHHFGGTQWAPMEPTQMLVLRRGLAVWSSHVNEPVKAVRAEQPLDASGDDGAPRQPKEHWPKEHSVVEPFGSSELAQSASAPAIVNIRSMMAGPDGTPLRRRTYHIYHRSHYAYTNPVDRSEHVFRLHPVEDDVQEIVHSTLSIKGGGEQIHFDDVFGNHSAHVTIDQPYTELEIVSDSEVVVYARPEDDFRPVVRRTSIPLVWMPWQRQMMSPYLLPPELPETQLHELTEYAMSFVERNDYHLMESLVDMNERIYEDFTYQSGSTTNETSPFEVYSTRTGVCQDFANLLICLARLLNVPSRYRVGYIHTGNKYDNPSQGDASHAWAEVYLPYLGWRGFDPTNGVLVKQDHVRVACGRNYRDATPTSGTIFRGGGTETLTVQVRVEEING